MENQKPKDPFAKVSTFAVIKKMQTGKSGREMVVTGFSLVGSQFDEIDDLASNQTEVMVTIQPSRRGTIYIGQDVSYRITKETHANAFDAIGELVIEASNDLRVKLLEWHNRKDEDVLEWDNVETRDQIQEMLTAALDEDNLVDAMACMVLLRNLDKQTYEEACEAQQEEEQQEDEDTLFDREGEESEQVQEEVEV